jgi:hypothetical protein
MQFNPKFLIILNLAFLLLSCGPIPYYQIQEFKKTQNVNTLPDNIFKNNDLVIEYDFWSRNGFTDFKISNTSDSLIYLDLELSHFVMNGLASPYYTNQVQMESNAYVSSRINSRIYGYSSNGVKYETSNTLIPSKILIIPPQTHKMVKGFNIALLYKACNLKHFTDSSSIRFNDTISPVVIQNLFYYTKGNTTKTLSSFENELSLNRVINVNQSKFYSFDYKYDCNQKASVYKFPYSKYKLNNRFYLEYYKTY